MNCRFALVVLSLAFAIGMGARAQQAAPPDIRDYVRFQPFERDAYRELSTSYDASATPALISMLDSEAEETNWEKAAYALGAIGDQRAVEALIAFVEKPRPSRTSKADVDARSGAIQSLGFLVNRTGNERALTYLIDGLTPEVWRERNIQGLPPRWTGSADDYDRFLSRDVSWD
jgi:HEAT repeat protein